MVYKNTDHTKFEYYGYDIITSMNNGKVLNLIVTN